MLKRVGLTQNVQDWHKKGRIDTICVRFTQKRQEWPKRCKIGKRVGLTQSGQDWHKKGRIDTKCVTLTQNVQD